MRKFSTLVNTFPAPSVVYRLQEAFTQNDETKLHDSQMLMKMQVFLNNTVGELENLMTQVKILNHLQIHIYQKMLSKI